MAMRFGLGDAFIEQLGVHLVVGPSFGRGWTFRSLSFPEIRSGRIRALKGDIEHHRMARLANDR
jgi:hypothetical protein